MNDRDTHQPGVLEAEEGESVNTEPVAAELVRAGSDALAGDGLDTGPLGSTAGRPRRLPEGGTDPRETAIRGHVRGILEELGLDLADPNLRETDRRVAQMYLEMFRGLEQGAEPKVTTFPNEEHYSHMVMEKDIPFYSMCAHHLVPFYGKAHIAYIPRERILGLSKFARILEFYAKRPQLQERLTEQVVNDLEERLQPLGAMVVIEARHLCVEMRGVKKPGATTTTSALRGVFHQRPVREEFLDLLRHN